MSTSTTRTVISRLTLFVAICLLAAYPASRFGVFDWPRAYDPLALPDLSQPPHFLTSWQLKLLDAEVSNCVLALRQAGLTAALKPTQNVGSPCEISEAVTVDRLSHARIKPEVMRCAVAARLYLWEKHYVQPLAKRYFGQQVSSVLHYGSYNCRTIRGGQGMSEHATANAFDISGFKLEDSRIISLRKDWTGTGPEAKFLRDVHSGLCDWFNATLSPDYNDAHADHFHVDLGWWQTCR